MSERACGKCDFWEQWSNHETFPEGFCRRYAPRAVIAVENINFDVQWPTTISDSWCGEFQPK